MKKVVYTLIPMLLLSCFVVLSAETKTDSLKIELLSARGINKARILNELANSYRKKMPEKFLDFSFQALDIARNLKNWEAEIDILYNIGMMYSLLNNNDKAFEYLDQSLKISTEIKNKNFVAKILNKTGLIHKNMGNYEKALDYFIRALNTYKGMKDDKGIAICLNNIGIVYKKKGDYVNALEYYLNALEIREKIGDKNTIAQSWNNIGTIYKALDDLDNALACYLKAYEMGKNICIKKNIATFLNNIGNIYLSHTKLRDLSKALEYYKKANGLYREIKNKKGEAISLINIGEVYNEKKDYNKAIEYLKNALSISMESNNKHLISDINAEIGNVYYSMKNYHFALQYLNKSLIIAEENNFNVILKEVYLMLHEIYSSTGKYKEALEYHKKYTAKKDTLFNKEKSTKIVGMLTNYIAEKKDKEIELLTKDKKIKDLELDDQKNLRNYLIIISILILILAIVLYNRYHIKHKSNKLLETSNNRLLESESALKELNSTKDKFFSIIAHDLKNPLGVFKNMTKVLAENYDKFNQEEIHENITEINKLANNIFELIENLLQWSRSQKGEIVFNPEMVDVSMLCNNCISLLKVNALNKKILLYSEVKSGALAFADMNMLSTVIRNLVSNAIKFTKENGEIKLSSRANGKFIEISVSDTGIGISKENINNLFRIDTHFTTYGTSDEKGTGLGLILCKEFIENHGGEIRINSEVGKGTVFTFTLPKAVT